MPFRTQKTSKGTPIKTLFTTSLLCVRFAHRFILSEVLIPYLHTWTTYANSDFKIKEPFSISSTISKENRESNQLTKYSWTFFKSTSLKRNWNGQSQRLAHASREAESISTKVQHIQIYSFLSISKYRLKVLVSK